jgi:hypothetical protein
MLGLIFFVDIIERARGKIELGMRHRISRSLIALLEKLTIAALSVFYNAGKKKYIEISTLEGHQKYYDFRASLFWLHRSTPYARKTYDDGTKRESIPRGQKG